MATKNIAIRDEAYDLLARYKLSGESFSDVIIEHFSKKKKLTDYAGIWADVPEKDWKEFEENVARARKGIDSSMQQRRRGMGA